MPGRPARWGYEVRTRGAVIEASAVLVHGQSKCEGNRGYVTTWSRRSRVRMCRAVASRQWDPNKVRLFITLTFAEAGKVDGRAELLRFQKRWARRFGWPSAVWWREFQERGTVHYHLLAEASPRDAVILRGRRVKPGGRREGWVHEAWVGCGGGRIVDVQLWRGQGKALFAYAMKYAMKYGDKSEQHRLPEGAEAGVGRWWGVWGSGGAWRVLGMTRAEFVSLRRRLRRWGQPREVLRCRQVRGWWSIAPPDLLAGLGSG